MNFFSENTLECLKYFNLSHQRTDEAEYASDRIFYTNFVSFIENQIFWNNKVLRPIFSAYKSNPENKETEAMFLLTLELAWHASEEYQNELLHKIERLKSLDVAKLSQHEPYLDPSPLQTSPEILQEYHPEAPVFQSNHIEILEENAPETEDGHEEIEESQTEIHLEEEHQESPGSGIIAVVWEFDKESGYALDYGVMLSKKMDTNLMLIHFTKKGKEMETALAEMKNKTKNEVRNKYGVEIDVKVADRNVNLSVAVKEVAEGNVKLIILGANSSQRQLNMVCNSQIPVMAVQAPPKSGEIKNVLFPVDNRSETKIKLKVAKEFADKLNLKFHISLPGKFMVDVTKLKTHNNLNFARSFFRQYNIEHETITIEDTKSFTDSTNISATQTETDLIMIMPQEKISFSGVVLGNEEQAIVKKNPQIPILFATTHGTSTKLVKGILS